MTNKQLDMKKYALALVMLIFSSLMCVWAILIAVNEGEFLFYCFAGVFGIMGILIFNLMRFKQE